MADEDGAFYLEAIEEYIKHKLPVEWAEDDLFIQDYKRPKHRPAQIASAKVPHGQRQKTRDKKPMHTSQPTPQSDTPKKKRRPRRKKPGSASTPPAATPE
jgi:ATP-dependent RNA helicase RhlB